MSFTTSARAKRRSPARWGGLDALVFTGGIGEHAAPIRAAIGGACDWLGAEIDDEANERGATLISRPSSRLTVRVIATNEELMIARHTRRVLDAA